MLVMVLFAVQMGLNLRDGSLHPREEELFIVRWSQRICCRQLLFGRHRALRVRQDIIKGRDGCDYVSFVLYAEARVGVYLCHSRSWSDLKARSPGRRVCSNRSSGPFVYGGYVFVNMLLKPSVLHVVWNSRAVSCTPLSDIILAGGPKKENHSWTKAFETVKEVICRIGIARVSLENRSEMTSMYRWPFEERESGPRISIQKLYSGREAVNNRKGVK